MAFSLRQLSVNDAANYRGLRLDGHYKHPEAFGASWADEEGRPLEWFEARLEGNRVFGGWLEDGSLAGVAGLSVPDAIRLRHKAVLWGMYVQPEARGTGLAAALVQHVIDQVGDTLEEILLTFMASNMAAAKLYAGSASKCTVSSREPSKLRKPTMTWC